jgi:hypothetical protein
MGICPKDFVIRDHSWWNGVLAVSKPAGYCTGVIVTAARAG